MNGLRKVGIGIALIAAGLALYCNPVEGQTTYGAGQVCVGPLSKEEVNYVRMSREGCDWAISVSPDSRGWMWADGWITAQTAYVWERGTGDGSQHALGEYQHEVGPSYQNNGTIILACASGGPRLGRGNGWLGTGIGLCMFTGTDGLGAPMLAPSIPIRAQGSIELGGLTFGLRPHVDLLIPMKRGTTVFQEWAYCERGTIGAGNGCNFKETGNDWRAIVAVYLTVGRD